MKKPNFVVYDIETSGFEPEKGAEVVQIAAIPINFWDLEMHHAGPFQIILKPNNPEKASPEAIKVIGKDLWEKALNEGIDQKVGLTKFCSYIDQINDGGSIWTRPIRVGHNIRRFDNPFIEFWMEHYGILKKNDRNEIEGPWHFWSDDTMDIYRLLFAHNGSVQNYKLDTCASILNISRTNETHDAMEDVQINTELFVRALKFIREMTRRMKVSE